MGCCGTAIGQKKKSNSPDQGLTIAKLCISPKADGQAPNNDPAGNEMQTVNQEVCKDKDMVKLRRFPIQLRRRSFLEWERIARTL